MSIEVYSTARREALREMHSLQARGEDPFLPVLADIVPELNRLPHVPLGLEQVSLSQIRGTATRGRTSAFVRGFKPILDPESEFASKWATLYEGVVEDGLREPVVALEYYNEYYIVEGNKRVSVMNRLGSVMIEANVTRVIPKPEDSERYRAYQAFLGFYEDTKINYIRFANENGYARLYALTHKKRGVRWTADELFDFHSCYYRFSQAYHTHPSEQKPMPVAEAFLLYLEIFGYAAAVNQTPAEFSAAIRRVLSEFVVAAANKPAALLSEPAEKQANPLLSIWHHAPRPLRCAFLYNRSPLDSGWTYWHELGRKALEELFGSRVTTVYREYVKPSEAEAVIDQWIKEGVHVVFATSPVFLEACMRQSVAHPNAKILNCSLLASYHNVRSYYLRIYEAKYILGAIAGAMADNNLIGYIADYPIYGVPASINAFALGAQMTNPRAKVVLEWSTIPGHNPEAALAAQDVHTISSRDISAPLMESRTFGLYQTAGEQNTTLAMPTWNWARLYEGIVRSILTGGWSDEAQQNADRALSYYMGMSSDAIDIVCSSRVPARLRRLVDLLHERISSGSFLPFLGPIVDQAGETRVAENVALTPQEIIRMDYLASNVVGSIPTLSELNESARSLASLQGVSAAIDGTEQEIAP